MWRKAIVLCLLPLALGISPDPPQFYVDLDAPPEERWSHIIKEYSEQIKTLYTVIYDVASPTEIYILGNLLKWTFLEDELAAEIKAASNLIGINYNAMILLSFFYELRAFCTSTVAKDYDGVLIHGRNLEYSLAPELRPLTINVEFTRGDAPVFKSTTFAGYFGILTAMKPGMYTISLDQRNAHGWFLWNVLSAAIGYQGNTLAIRKCLETVDTFEGVISYISKVHLVTDAYYIIAGVEPDEAAVITRNRRSPANIWRMSGSMWYLVETNYDHWKAAPSWDDRRSHAKNFLDSVGQSDMDYGAMYEMLSTPPVLAPHTIHTTVMSAKTWYYSSKIRHVSSELAYE